MDYFDKYNARVVLDKVELYLAELEQSVAGYRAICGERASVPAYRRTLIIRKVFDDLSIFDWWNDRLSISQLKDMRAFLREAIKLGFTGYVCFKVGATGCANGMWAHETPTVDGFSPRGDNFLYRSFTPDYTYWDVHYDACDERLTGRVGVEFDTLTTIKKLEKAIEEDRINV